METGNKSQLLLRQQRPSFESKMLLSLPLTNSNSNTSKNTSNSLQNGSPGGGNNGNSISEIDFSLLDYKSAEDFLIYSTAKIDLQTLSKHLAKQLKVSRSLLSLSRFLVFGNNPRELITKIVDSASAIIDAERVLFLELEESGDLIYTKPQDNTGSEMTYRIKDGIEYEVAMNHRYALINSFSSESKCNSELYKHLRIVPRNMICVPVTFSEKASGVLLALNKISSELVFSQFDVTCLQSIAANIAILLRQVALSLGQIDIRISRTSSSYPTCEEGDGGDFPAIRSATPQKQINGYSRDSPPVELDNSLSLLLSKLVEEAGQELCADKMSLFLPHTPSRLKCVVSPDILGLEIPTSKGIVGDTFTSRQHHIVVNPRADPRFYSEVDKLAKSETNSLLSYPIVVNRQGETTGSRVVGVVQAINKRGGVFTEEDAAYMSDLCSRVADVLSASPGSGSTKNLSRNSSPQDSPRDIFRSLSEFSSLLNRVDDSDYISHLLTSLHNYGATIGECDEIHLFSVVSSTKDDDTHLELSPVSLNPQSPEAKLSNILTGSYQHTSLILNALKSNQFQELQMALSPQEADEVGSPLINTIAFPVTYTSNIHLSSKLKGRSIDLLLAVRKSPSPFSPTQTTGLSALVRLLIPALSLYGHILETKDSVTTLQSNQLMLSSSLDRLGVMVFVVTSTGKIIMYSRSWQRFLSANENEFKTQTLAELLGDRSPAFMADIKEAIRSHSPIERKNVRLFTASHPDGVSVNYDIHEYKNTVYPFEVQGNNSFFRVILSVLSHTEFNCDDSENGDYLPFVPAESHLESTKNIPKDPRYMMKSTPDAQTLRSPRQFSTSDVAEIDRLFTWEFNVLNIVDAAARRYCIIAVLEKDLNLPMLNISRNQLAAFVAEVEKNYRLNPFHNFFHAVCVTHFISMLMRETQARIHINNDLMYFSMMASAVVHDVDHPGNTNLFEINSCSELALLYNDIGVLENHHCATAFRIMKLPGLDIFGQLTFAQKTLARKTIISCIMATDMALHVGLVEQMAARTGQPWMIDTPAEKLFYGKIILHSADLSNPVRPFYLSKEWACRVSEEFNRQGEMEKARGLPVSTFLLTPDTKTLAKNEIYFSGQVVAPMWRSLAALFPTLQHLAVQIESNVESWKELLASLE